MKLSRFGICKSMVLAASLLVPAVAVEAGTFTAAGKDGVPGEYLVVLREEAARLSLGSGRADLPEVGVVAAGLARQHGVSLNRVWDRALRGFLIHTTESAARRLSQHPLVASVEQNVRIYEPGSAPVASCYRLDSYPWGSLIGRTPPSASPQTITCDDSDPTHDSGGFAQPPRCRDNWGLDRIDQRGTVRDGLYTFDRTGRTPGGVNPTIFFLDTGINAEHQEFLGLDGINRVTSLNVSDDPSCPTTDLYGHGTHVAGIAAGRTFGVAKNAYITMVRTSTCGESARTETAWIIDGLNRVAGHRPGVLNWSGGNDMAIVGSNAVRSAVQGVVNSGMLVIQAAGNQSSPYVLPGWSPASYPSGVEDACSWSFGLLPGVLVVGGIDQNGARWTRHGSGDLSDLFCVAGCAATTPYSCDCGSNVGSCIDLWAPAANILSVAGLPDDTFSYCRLSGTSMAAPHVAGAAALYLQAHPWASPAEVEAALIAGATTGVLNSNSQTPNHIGANSPNRLLYSKVP